MPRTLACVITLMTTILGFLVPAAAAAGPTQRLVATVGPARQISLMRGGRKVSAISKGTYLIVVRDRSKVDNFHLQGPDDPAAPRVDRRTRIPFVGTVTWRVTFRGAGQYIFRSDRKSSTIGGSFRVR